MTAIVNKPAINKSDVVTLEIGMALTLELSGGKAVRLE
jgi:hypothetical protein